MKYCSRYDLIPRNLLADYAVRSAPKPHKYMPSEGNMSAHLDAIHNYWDEEKNRSVRVFPSTRRSFHRGRNYAIIMTLLDSACRIGEVLSLKVTDLQQVTVQVKGKDKSQWRMRTIRKGPCGQRM